MTLCGLVLDISNQCDCFFLQRKTCSYLLRDQFPPWSGKSGTLSSFSLLIEDKVERQYRGCQNVFTQAYLNQPACLL